jgi:hypothetical protein
MDVGGQQRPGHVLGSDAVAQGAGVAVDGDGRSAGARPPQVPGAVGQTSAALDSWMVKVAVFGSARAPLAVMIAPTVDMATISTTMVASRLPIGLTLPVDRMLLSPMAAPAGALRFLPGHGHFTLERHRQPSSLRRR